MEERLKKRKPICASSKKSMYYEFTRHEASENSRGRQQ